MVKYKWDDDMELSLKLLRDSLPKEFHIKHRSSLVKRLDKNKQLLDFDLSSPNLRLYYRICFELIHRAEP